MNRSILSTLVAVTLSCTVVGSAFGGPTDAQKCQSKKIQEAGKYSLCRLKAEAKAAKDGSAPDFSKCNEKLNGKFQKIDEKFGSACPTTGDASQVQSQIADFAAALSCQLQGSSEPPGGSIVALQDVQVAAGSDPILSIRNLANNLVYANCFFASATVCSPIDFQVVLPLHSEIDWQASAGSPGDGIPALASPFSGDLVCVEIDASGFPIPGESLAASATYSGQCPMFGIPISGFDTNNGDNVLCLGGGISGQCPTGAEYDSCPAGIDPSRIEGCWSQVPLPSPPYFPGTELTFVCGT